jgi:hypothetical protein
MNDYYYRVANDAALKMQVAVFHAFLKIIDFEAAYYQLKLARKGHR